MAKIDIAHYEQFHLLSQYFQKSFAADASKYVYRWERVKGKKEEWYRLLVSVVGFGCWYRLLVFDRIRVNVFEIILHIYHSRKRREAILR